MENSIEILSGAISEHEEETSESKAATDAKASSASKASTG